MFSNPKFHGRLHRAITSIDSLEGLAQRSHALRGCTLHGLNLHGFRMNWEDLDLQDTFFLGCAMPAELETTLRRNGAFIFPAAEGIPYNPYRTSLYDWRELAATNGDGRSRDLAIYEHFSKQRQNPSLSESLWQRLHDHAIDEGLRQLLQYDENGLTNLRCVAMMGGHATKRTHHHYHLTAKTAYLLAGSGYFIASGGGPGIMEATNLGAWLSPYPAEALEHALALLAPAPHYTDDGYEECAKKVLQHYPDGAQNLAIPTWFYGHEPSNLFATHIAKYFSNSIREDTLLAIALHGIVFAPGSAGTTQEIFMDAAQNHYGTFNYISPMVFLDQVHYGVQAPIYPLLQILAEGRAYKTFLHLTDSPEDALAFIQQHPPSAHG